jgi:hypothetical protein
MAEENGGWSLLESRNKKSINNNCLEDSKAVASQHSIASKSLSVAD